MKKESARQLDHIFSMGTWFRNQKTIRNSWKTNPRVSAERIFSVEYSLSWKNLRKMCFALTRIRFLLRFRLSFWLSGLQISAVEFGFRLRCRLAFWLLALGFAFGFSLGSPFGFAFDSPSGFAFGFPFGFAFGFALASHWLRIGFALASHWLCIGFAASQLRIGFALASHPLKKCALRWRDYDFSLIFIYFLCASVQKRSNPIKKSALRWRAYDFSFLFLYFCMQLCKKLVIP